MYVKLLFCLCVAFSPLISGLSDGERAEIVNSHNGYRASVKPEAANMLSMTYHEDAEKTAQNWASQCKKLTHDSYSNMKDRAYGFCGQNIFVSSVQVPWSQAVEAWHSEVSEFTYNSMNNNFADIGHYTQVVWANSHKVGCGYARCRDTRGVFHNYVCNYCPAGNIQGQINTPYKQGKRCSACPGSCLSSGLCAP